MTKPVRKKFLSVLSRKEALSKKLLDRRTSLGLTRTQFADRYGISTTAVRSIELRLYLPRPRVMTKLEAAFNISTEKSSVKNEPIRSKKYRLKYPHVFLYKNHGITYKEEVSDRIIYRITNLWFSAGDGSDVSNEGRVMVRLYPVDCQSKAGALPLEAFKWLAEEVSDDS